MRASVPSVKVACFPTLKTASDLHDGGSDGSALEAKEPPSANGLTMALWLPIVMVVMTGRLGAF